MHTELSGTLGINLFPFFWILLSEFNSDACGLVVFCSDQQGYPFLFLKSVQSMQAGMGTGFALQGKHNHAGRHVHMVL